LSVGAQKFSFVFQGLFLSHLGGYYRAVTESKQLRLLSELDKQTRGLSKEDDNPTQATLWKKKVCCWNK